MKKIAVIITLGLFSLGLLSSCSSSRQTCPAYSDVQTNQTEQLNVQP
jgi:hypothetical protein